MEFAITNGNIMQKTAKEFRAWEREKKLIPKMIKIYCRGNHGTKGENICEECKKLTEYALFRLEKCPFKVNKQFCSFCKVHCYKPDMREKIKDVMKWAGPRVIFTHPVFAFKHVFQMIAYKRKLKKDVPGRAFGKGDCRTTWCEQFKSARAEN